MVTAERPALGMALGMALGSRQGRPGSDAQKGVGSLSRRLFRAALAPTSPPDLAAAAAAAAAAADPPDTSRGPDGVPTPPI